MTRKKGFITRQARRLSAGEINRRRFVMQALSVGVTLPTAMSLAARAEGMHPRKGGLFRHATGSGSSHDTLDPAKAFNGFTRHAIFTRGNHLTEVARTGELVGELAEQVEPSVDAQTWAFTLRNGVVFHDGKPLTPEDIIATFNYHRSSHSNSTAKRQLTTVCDIRKDGNRRVVFELDRANASFDRVVSDHSLMILPSRDGEVDPLSPIGTGGYILDDFQPGNRALFSRNPSYWKADAAHFDAIELLALPEVAARQHAIMNGDVHYADQIDPNTVALIQRTPTLDVLEIEGMRQLSFPMRTSVPPFDNDDLRMALSFAIHRQELVDKVLLGHGRAPDKAAIHQKRAELPLNVYNPDLASMYYRKSGHSGPITLTASDAAFTGAVDAARLIAASASNAGIEIAVDQVPNDTSNSDDPAACGWFASSLAVHDGCKPIVAMLPNELSAHSKSLAHTKDIAANLENDGNKIAERWWFS